MKRRLLLFVLVLACVFSSGLSFAACDSGDGSISNLIVYTNQPADSLAAMKKLVKDEGFAFDVTFVSLSGQNLKNRLIAEKAAPIADVVLGGSILEHMDLKKEKATAPFFPEWVSTIDEDRLDADGYYTPWAIEPLYLVYNEKYYTSDPSKVTATVKAAPTSYEDLADNFAGKYNLFKTTGSTGPTIYASILSQYRDPNGTHNISTEGWNVLKKLFSGGELDKGLWQENLAGSKFPISMTWAGAIVDIENIFEVDIGIVRPEIGVPVNVTQIAITDSKKTNRMNAAKEFVEWWGKTETQVAWSAISGQAPANKDALALIDEDVVAINTAKAMDLDWQFISDNLSSWIKYIELSILG